MGRHFLLHKSDIKILKNCLEAITLFVCLFNGHSCCDGDGLELVWSSCTLEWGKISHGTWVTPKPLILLLDPEGLVFLASLLMVSQVPQPNGKCRYCPSPCPSMI